MMRTAISDDEAQFFNNNGYLIVRGVLQGEALGLLPPAGRQVLANRFTHLGWQEDVPVEADEVPTVGEVGHHLRTAVQLQAGERELADHTCGDRGPRRRGRPDEAGDPGRHSGPGTKIERAVRLQHPAQAVP